MIVAADFYVLATYAIETGMKDVDVTKVPTSWPREAKYWRPESSERNLVKAGALIAAEIDRLKRLESKGT